MGIGDLSLGESHKWSWAAEEIDSDFGYYAYREDEESSRKYGSVVKEVIADLAGRDLHHALSQLVLRPVGFFDWRGPEHRYRYVPVESFHRRGLTLRSRDSNEFIRDDAVIALMTNHDYGSSRKRRIWAASHRILGSEWTEAHRATEDEVAAFKEESDVVIYGILQARHRTKDAEKIGEVLLLE
jgi:hypothetical protein